MWENPIKFDAVDAVDAGDAERGWIYTFIHVAALLSDDEVRAHYDHYFVPALSGRRTDFWKSEEGVRQARLDALIMLCK